MPSPVLEQCSVHVTANDLSFLLCCIYRTTSAKLAEWQALLLKHIEFLAQDKLPFLLMGDFNINLIADPSFAIDLKTNFHLLQLIAEHTHITKSTATLIDHIYASTQFLISESWRC